MITIIIVHFPVPPMISVPNQLVGAVEGQRISLECLSEAYPKSINYWTRDKGEIVPTVPQGKFCKMTTLLYTQFPSSFCTSTSSHVCKSKCTYNEKTEKQRGGHITITCIIYEVVQYS